MFNFIENFLNKTNGMKNWILVGTFFCLWLATNFSSSIQSYFAYTLILTFGILHGANDINIMLRESSASTKKKAFWKNLGLYLITIALILGLFLVHPLSALALFVLFSGFHFGEQHFKKKILKTGLWANALYTLYGTTILTMIFFAKAQEVAPIIAQLTHTQIAPSLFEYAFLFFLTATGLLYATLYMQKNINAHTIKEAFYLVVLFVVFKTANLLWGFCIYFVLWHSVGSIRDQLQFLYGKVDLKALKRYVKACFPYWLVSILGLAIVYHFFRHNDTLLISVLLYTLAAITFPHIIVMSRLEKKS